MPDIAIDCLTLEGVIPLNLLAGSAEEYLRLRRRHFSSFFFAFFCVVLIFFFAGRL
jgi:hypothetical protein